MKKYIIFSAIFLFNCVESLAQKKGDKPKSALKKNNSKPQEQSNKETLNGSQEKAKKTVAFNDQATLGKFSFEGSMLGQMADLSPAHDLERTNYVQNQLIKEPKQAQEKLQAIRGEVIDDQEEVLNVKVSVVSRFEGFSKKLNTLSQVFSHIIPKQLWDVYQVKKYSLLASQYNELLKMPELIASQINEMIKDLFDIAPEIIKSAESYLVKQQENTSNTKIVKNKKVSYGYSKK